MTPNTGNALSKLGAKSKKNLKQKVKSNIGRAIRVNWLDHYSHVGWTKKTDPDPVKITSVGYIVSETPKMLVLAQNAVLDETNDPGGNHIGIIKACITGKKYI